MPNVTVNSAVAVAVKQAKNLIMKPEGGVSWSKGLAWLTGALAVISQTAADITAAGLTIPTAVVPYIKYAAILSGVITIIRTRNSGNKSTPV